MNALIRLSQYSFVRFGFVGAAGYIVDNIVLFGMLNFAHADYYSGRLVSVLTAMTFTWLGNRYLTFKAMRAHGPVGIFQEWLRFVSANAVGALINFALYAVLVTYADRPLGNPFVALPIGVLVGMTSNYFLSKHLVFSRQKL